MSALNAREQLRRQFRPEQVRLLFVGESPPASGRFFYQRDSGLYRAMRDAFRLVDDSIDDENFLQVFQTTGHYLIDLCPEPVDNLEPITRRAMCTAHEPALAESIAQLRPVSIATLLRSIESNVIRAASAAGWEGQFIHLPYPGRWLRHRNEFAAILRSALSNLPTGS